MTSIDFYFDFVSPFSYLAWMRLREREARGAFVVRPHPVVFGALLDAWGHKGPAEIPPKREFTWRTCLRAAARDGIPLRFPAMHPFNPLTALRVALREVSGAAQPTVIDALYRAAWQQGVDLGLPEQVARALTAAGLDGEGLVARTRDQSVKDLLREATAAAYRRGIFGVPTMLVGDELFWGNDQIEVIEDVLAGRDILDRDALAAALATPVGVIRKGQ